MREAISEFGLLIVAVVSASVVFALFNYMTVRYEAVSKTFIGSITGVYVDYHGDNKYWSDENKGQGIWEDNSKLSLQEIEKW